MPMPESITNPNMPKALGPYSHAVRLGDLLFVAGQAGINPTTGTAPDMFDAQARQAFQNLATVLDAAGSSLQHVAKTTVFLTDAANFPKMNELYAEFSRPIRRYAPRPLFNCPEDCSFPLNVLRR
jgi:2-iminobutanoate/2-iminopropanoate deaminase